MRKKKTYRLHHIAPLELLDLGAAQGHAVRHARVRHAGPPVDLLESAVLQRRPPDLALALLVPLQHVHQLLVVALGLGLDLRQRPVRLPQVRVSPILELALSWHCCCYCGVAAIFSRRCSCRRG